jgi:cytochrome c oxidase subunit 1/cytochrome c oxidase subunit I+III
MSARPILDVSELTERGFDTRATAWWGNNWLLAIETTMFALAVGAYFYLRQNFEHWPPPLAQMTAPLHPLPDLTFGTLTTIVLLLGCLPMILTDRAARREERTLAQIGLAICICFGITAIVFRCFEFPAVKFRWDSNAYGSIVWFILGMHLTHLLVVTIETLFMFLWSILREFDMKHRIDITSVAVYYYWVTGVWLVLYAIIYFTPRLS